MAASPYPAQINPALCGALIERLTRPGVCSAQIQWAAASEAFAVPQNNSRIYLAFSLATIGTAVTVTPGETDTDCGFFLSPQQPFIEWAGQSIHPLISSMWRATGDVGTFLNIIAINRD